MCVRVSTDLHREIILIAHLDRLGPWIGLVRVDCLLSSSGPGPSPAGPADQAQSPSPPPPTSEEMSSFPLTQHHHLRLNSMS